MYVIIVYQPLRGQMVLRMHIVNFNIKPTYVNKVRPRATKFGMVTSVGEGLFRQDHAMTPIQRQRRPRTSIICDFHAVCHSNQIVHGD